MSCICYDSRAVPRFLDVKRKFDIWMSNLWFFPCILCQIFTLSAVPFNRMPTAILECFFVLKPGGLLLFRDYGNAQTWITIYIRVCIWFIASTDMWIADKCWVWWNVGLYDMTMLRFEADKRVGFREYMRSDGTRSYFFSLETVRDLFVGAGFIEVLALFFLPM